jgi:RimJ/RimL family protein N-acetyltransferase
MSKTAKKRKNMELQTERLILRAWQESDAESLYKYAQNPNIGPIAGWQPHTSVENSREIIKTVLSAPETYAVVLKETGEAVGSIGIMTTKGENHTAKMTESECEIGYWIGEPFWGRGFIPEVVNEILRYAFEVLEFTAVWCAYYDGNEKSKRVQEKCGFVYSHTEYNKPVPLLNEFRTEHFTKITLDNWKKSHENISHKRQELSLASGRV